ncbi:MAG: hypothetical protein V5A72_03185 [Candidatus Nanohaloarchaea archaeon]
MSKFNINQQHKQQHRYQKMADYHTQNLKKQYYKDLKKFLENYPEYSSVKEFMKQATNEKREQLEEKEIRKKELEKKG